MPEDKKVTPISSLGEFGLINRITSGFEAVNPGTLKGVGDDAAVIDSLGKKTIVSTDLLV